MTGGLTEVTVVRILYKLTRPSKSVEYTQREGFYLQYASWSPHGPHQRVHVAVASHYGLIGFAARADAGLRVGKLLPQVAPMSNLAVKVCRYESTHTGVNLILQVALA
jgi:hypothetical protein